MVYYFLLTPFALPFAIARVKFLTGGRLLTRFGHTALEPALYVMTGLLGLRPNYTGVLLVPPQAIVNWSLLQYWRPYFKIVSHPVLMWFLRPLERHPLLTYNTYYVRFPGRRHVAIDPAIYPIQTQYETIYGGKPLLTLSHSDSERGWRCLEDLGIPRGAWFVCLHVREAGYLGDYDRPIRNSDVMTYLLAVEAIVQRGGWVIRMGNPTMKPLPFLDQVIDYAHSDVRSQWMDVFCLSTCKFYLGSNSGPSEVSFVFGVPCTNANVAPMKHGMCSSRELFIPKLYWAESEARYLTFAEVLRSPLRDAYYQQDFESAGVVLINNTQEEIRDLVVERLDRLDGTTHYTLEDQQLQEYYQSLLATDLLYQTSSCVGRDFLRKYKWLLLGEAEVSGSVSFSEGKRGSHRLT